MGKYKKHLVIPMQDIEWFKQAPGMSSGANSKCVHCGKRFWINWWMEI